MGGNARTPAELAMAKEMRRIIEGRRRGAQKPRKPSEAVRRGYGDAAGFLELSPNLQKHPRGTLTVEQLLKTVRAMGHRPGDTLAKDLAKVRHLIGLIQQGKALPSLSKPIPERRMPSRGAALSERTLLEQEAGRRAVALAEARMALIGLIQRRFLGIGCAKRYDFWEIS